MYIRRRTLRLYGKSGRHYAKNSNPINQVCIYNFTLRPFKTTNLNFYAITMGYLRNQWLPKGPQFLKCFIRNYKNYGIRSSQRSKAQHFSSKVFFDNNLANLHTLLSRLQEMVKQKEIKWKQEYAREASIRRHDHKNCPLRRELATNITYRALNLLRDQFVMASSARLKTHDLGDCTGAFTAQYGLPCKHIIHDLLTVEIRNSGARAVVATRPLRLQDVCLYWRLPHRLEDVDPLLAEMDPRVMARKHRPRNTPEEGIMPPSGTVIRRSAG